jgi:hypothetical protein
MKEEKKEKQVLTVVQDGEESKKIVNKPTEKETEQYKNEFQDALKAFDDKRWEISEPGKFGANDVGLYLLDFMQKYAHWSKTEWMGMIKMEDEIKKAMNVADVSTGLQFGYQALEFCAYMLTNTGGTGVALAKEFESQAEKYSKIGIVVGTKIEEARRELKNLQYLQERYAAACQGFFLSDLEPKKEETPIIEGNSVEIDVTDNPKKIDSEIVEKNI